VKNRKKSKTGGKAIAAAARPTLEFAGWVVIDFEHNDKMPTGAIGWPDLVAMRFSVIWLIEIKAPGDDLRPSQIRFFQKVYRHLGPTLRYMIAQTPEDIEQIVTGSPAVIEIPEKFRKDLEVRNETE